MAAAPVSNRNSIAYMREAVLFEGPERSRKLSRFWILLTLAAVIGDRENLVRSVVLVVIGAMTVLVGIPPASATIGTTVATTRQSTINEVSQSWAQSMGWELVTVTPTPDGFTVRVTGAEPVPDTAELQEQLEAAGIDPGAIDLELVPSYTVELGG